jgi:hypothetical protein
MFEAGLRCNDTPQRPLRGQVTVTEYGRIGCVAPEAEIGDIVCFRRGADTPHLLRLVDDG